MSVQVGGIRHLGTPTSSSSGTAWDPVNIQQNWEADTIFLLDPDSEDGTTGTKTQGVDGLMVANGGTNGTVWLGTSKVNKVPGKFRNGLTYNSSATDVANAYLWIPADGLLPVDEFTIEFWAKSSVNWNSVPSKQYLIALGDNSSGYLRIWLNFVSGTNTVQAQYLHNQGNTTASIQSQKSCSVTVKNISPAPAAEEWHNIAVTYKSGALTLYFDGATSGAGFSHSTGVVDAKYFGALNGSDGLSILGNKYGSPKNAPNFTLSDLRISRKARTPGTAIIPNGDNIISVYKDSWNGLTDYSGQIQKGLLGGLHPFSYDYQGGVGETNLKNYATGIRTDGFLSVTPISTTQDSDHPTSGHYADHITGAHYYYDWQVVDRTINYIIETLGLEPYITIDGAPYILAGGTAFAPFSNSQMTDVLWTGGGNDLNNTLPFRLLTRFSKWPNALPKNSPATAYGDWRDYSQYATMVRDMIYHILYETNQYSGKGYSGKLKYMSVWNEPVPSGTFWSGTQSDYLNMYNAVATAVKDVDSTIKVGGPENATGYITNQSWITAMANNCASTSITTTVDIYSPSSSSTNTYSTVPFDFVAWHHYQGNHAEIYYAKAHADLQFRTANTTYSQSMSLPEMTIGEWAWLNPANQMSAQTHPVNRDDWGAGFIATGLMAMQNQNVTRAFFYHALQDPEDSTNFPYGNNASNAGLVAPTFPMVGINVFRLWGLMASNIVTTSVQAAPGIHAIASTDGAGKITVFISCFHYRNSNPSGTDFSIKILVPDLSSNATVTNHYAIDSSHSIYTGPTSAQGPFTDISHKDLETTTPPINNGQITITAKARSVHLLVIQ